MFRNIARIFRNILKTAFRNTGLALPSAVISSHCTPSIRDTSDRPLTTAFSLSQTQCDPNEVALLLFLLFKRGASIVQGRPAWEVPWT